MNVVDEYLINLAAPQKLALTNVRRIITQTVPDAEAVFTYGMPGYKYKGKYLISFGVFKDHMSIFPGADAIEAYKDKLAGFKLSKGTIQFTTEQQIPDELIAQIVTHRMHDIDT